MTKVRTAARPNMADVGRLANVSSQTVSRYFTGVGYVRAETRKRITDAIEQLGYVPNQSARALRTSRTNSVGVLAMGAFNYGSAGVLTGLGLAAREADVTLTIAQLDLDFEAKDWEVEARRALAHFKSVQVDGIVLSTPLPDVDKLLADWDQSTPLITVSELPSADEGSAGTHSYAAGWEATHHLIELGHRDIVHVAGPSTRNEARERERGYRDAMQSAGLTPHVLDVANDWSSVSGYRAGELADPATFTAVFASNDEIALGFISALERRGTRAPEDFSIVGVDDMPAAAYFSPPLTTMRLDFRALGVATFKMLHHQILTGERAQHYVVEPELVIRESTARIARP
ncbi:LacI family DNA-binding transcriptional regulator [Arthrobacter sp. ISL-69]|uniref:LacI family DNA-binding transcriptional regulator n=1 Tax=Arthrobacter sp. ISL-69 TaxID=2819113 RepID=UPI001BE566BE|nr:LacI family DNA-binding transcriptional regulator [Arthrobacter sp. ISL-69]MBT2534816.1 LacI family DNA-binding transcriptional regulator [Arthrobacter sp. ISL-69]